MRRYPPILGFSLLLCPSLRARREWGRNHRARRTAARDARQVDARESGICGSPRTAVFAGSHLEAFFGAVADSAFSEEEAGRQWSQFVSTADVPQGAFYPVGYLMAQTVEQQLGRDRLLASLCDPFLFMLDYSEAVKRSGLNLPVWSATFLDRFRR